MFDSYTLQNINWFIQFEPNITSIYRRDTNENISYELYNKIILNYDNDITLNFPLDNDLTVYESIIISGTQTIKSLFEEIYKFYQNTMKEENIQKIFEDNQDILDELLFDRKNDLSLIKNIDILNIDIFSFDVCIPDFVGLEQDLEDFTIFNVLLFNVLLEPE
jgi:hypothetical protein